MPGPRDADGGAFGTQLQSLIPMLTMMTAQRGGGSGSVPPWVQVAVAMLLPLLLQSLMPRVHAALHKAGCLLKTETTRTISFTRDPARWWRQDKDDDELFNGIIQRAILKFINTELPDVAKGWKESNVQAHKEEKTAACKQSCSASDNSSSCSDADSEHISDTVLGASYNHYSYLCAPPDGVWVDLKNGIQLERTVSRDRGDDSSGRSSQIVTTFTLRSSGSRNGARRLNSFIDRCVELYNEDLRKKVDVARYMFTPVLSAACLADDKTKSAMLYKKYKLAESRTFASFFHPERDAILGLVDQFSAKTGKFAIPGYPVKLGFLLHGPPGTGKTSFIKALAHYTNRHIVNIPLAKIKTNQELMNLMFDQSIVLAGSEDGSAMTLPHNRVIFVMEDVDAASGVVHRRDAEHASSSSAGAESTAMPSDAMAEAMAMAAAIASSSKPDKAAGGACPGDSGSGSGCSTTAQALTKASPSSDSDKLNLAGLLNVLDGVVDTPERIVVLTTNHPEKLDPALIRPGRINRRLYLGNIRYAQAASMVRHYFNGGQPLPEEQEQRLAAVFVDDLLPPAMVESMCAEHDTIDAMTDELAGRVAAATAALASS